MLDNRSLDHAYWYAKGIADSNPVFQIKPERFQAFVAGFMDYDCRTTPSLKATTIEELWIDWVATQKFKVKY